MIDVHYWPTPNGWKVTIMLEELGLPYTVVPVDIGGGDQFKSEFLRISPNNRMPAIVDHAPADGGKAIAVFESGAILEYLADKEGKFLPKDPRGRAAVQQWVHWQMANLGPMMGNANHFKNYAKTMVDDPAQLAYGEKRFVGESDRLAGVMDAQLGANRYLAGADYSIADIITWPWAMFLNKLVAEDLFETFPNLGRWVNDVGERPAVQAGYAVKREWRDQELTEEQQKTRREMLFNQDSKTVQKAREAAAKAAAG